MLFLKGEKINAYFRKLENPEHDNWRPERSDQPDIAKQNITNLKKFILTNLKDLENATLPESENVEGINSLLDEDYDSGNKEIRGLEFKPLRIIEQKRRMPKKTRLIKKILGGGEGRGKKEGEFLGKEKMKKKRQEKRFL
jgi:hypothetical protein